VAAAPDDGSDDGSDDVRYATSPWVSVGLAAAAIALALMGWTTDAPGRLLSGIAAAGLAAEAGRTLIRRPTLQADPQGVTLPGAGARPWVEVQALRVIRTGRLGGGGALEVDLGERVIVIPAYRLGTDPDSARATLEQLRSGRRSAAP